ncbi:rhamnogalacturonan-hydrolase [Rhizoctonia solani AG-3 Rhs1AP]|uniref:Rhamnogalacturonan-hydrolase n=1 Tax=Rhizoctonia solani AG-3 Rhs1AP TaxID=1086054 RepID=X8J3W2_9AGAM|nr:rhamnogalacturonan-hydrolase [Rhizoctonia solani AG-3 Rhs1AP]
MHLFLVSTAALLASVCQAQHVGRVGPTVPVTSKKYPCNVLDYGAKADNATDIGPAIKSAFTNCIVKNHNSRLVVPAASSGIGSVGNYLLSTTVLLNGASNWAFQLDGLITVDYSAYVKGTVAGNALVFQRMNEFELYSSNGKGAIQGQGYLYRLRPKQAGRAGWPRLLRVHLSTNFAVHDLKLVDAPAFHLVVSQATNAEVHRITIRGGNQGGLDGVDISGTNYHVHHVEVTNRDECVCVKSPSKQATIENIRCNQSGGSTIGSLKDGSVIENILFQNIENYQVTNAFMLKTYPGGASPGYVKNVVLRNFTNIDVTYNAYITQYWQNSYAAGTSNVQLSNILFSDWRGSVSHGGNRGAVVMIGSDTNPPVNINVKNFSFWTTNGNKVVDRCSSTYGSGSCIEVLPAKGTPTKYATVSVTATAAPAGWVKPSAPWGIPPYGKRTSSGDRLVPPD